MKILVIQTAFIGDVILATPLLRALSDQFPEAQLDILVRKGNESLLRNFSGVSHVYTWDKTTGKNKHLLQLLSEIRKSKYDEVINLQRFASTGFLTAFSNGKNTTGFDKNPFSFLFTNTIKHEISTKNTRHEVERNFKLIAHLTDVNYLRPVLYPSPSDFEKVKSLKIIDYVTLAPASVWFTKQLPEEKWIELIHELRAKKGQELQIYLNGGPGDSVFCESILLASKVSGVVNLAGSLSLLQTAALMRDAKMNFVNDSAPLHLASAMNAPVTAFFCSTIPSFGFGPLSDIKNIIETEEKLNCRPCGLHGFSACPKGHFKCGFGINVESAVEKF